MGKLIQFKQKVEVNKDQEKIERIKASLDRINKLMEDLKVIAKTNLKGE